MDRMLSWIGGTQFYRAHWKRTAEHMDAFDTFIVLALAGIFGVAILSVMFLIYWR